MAPGQESSQEEGDGQWATAKRTGGLRKYPKLGTGDREARLWLGPSEGGDSVASLMLTLSLAAFWQVLEIQRTGREDMCTCVGGVGQQVGLEVKDGGDMGCPIKPPPPGAAAIPCLIWFETL